MYSTSSCFRDTKSSSLDTLVLRVPSQEKWNHFGIIILSLPNYLLWNVFILATVVLNYILVTLDLTFPQENYEHFLYFYVIFDIFYLFNLFILVLHKTFDQTLLPLFPKVDSSLVTIIIDFLSLVPQLLLLLVLVDHSFSFFIPLLRVPSILRLWHLNLFKKVLGKLPENRWKWFVAQYGIIFCLSVHTANCVWYLICGEDCQNKLYDSVSKTHRNPTDWYLFHIYYSIQILLNIGYGDTFPKNFNEIYLFSALLLIGQALVVWLVCYVTWLLIYLNYHKICIAHKIKDAIKYVDDTDVSTKSKISTYYSMKEHNNFKDNSLLENLPFSLKQDIFYDLNCGLLHRSMILKELPDVMLKRISLAMKSVTLPAGENIYFQYVVKTCMVCIEDGILEVLNDEDQESPVILFRNGTVLGEVALFFNIPSKASVRAKTNVDLRILEKRDFLEIMYRFPEHLKILQTILSKRLLSANKTPKTIQKFCLPSLRRLKVKLSNIIVKDDIDMDSEEEYYDLYRLYGDKNKEANVADNRSVLFKTWRIISDIGQIAFCVIYPYYAVFEKDVPESLNYFGICTDISYLFDIIFQSTTPIKIEGRMVTSVSEILDQRLNQWTFNLDVFSLFPIEVWSALFENTTLENRFFDLFKLNRLLRLHRLIGILKLLNEDINISITMKILNVLICCTLCSYYSACILYLNACFVIICNDSSWYYLIPRKINEDANDSNSAIVDSLYFTVTSSFHTGIGDILPKSRSDYWIITILVVSFLILKSYWVGKITSFMFLNTLCSGFLETTYYFNYLTEVYRIPSNLKNKLYNFLKIDQHFFIENSKILIHETVPNSLETQIQLSRTKDIWRKVRFFKKVDTYFLALVENHVHFWTIPNKEIVYFYGDPTRRMFVLRRGFCDLYNSENSLEKTVGPGSQLGLLEMIYCLPKKYTVVTKTDCILFYLDYFAFDHILKLFPKEYDTLESVTFEKHLLESVAKLEIIEDTYENNEFKGLIEKEKNEFINMTNKWPNYCEIYREKLGIFWGLSLILIPVTIYPESFCLKVWCIIRVCFIVIEAIIYGIIIVMAPYANDVSWISWVCQGTLYLDMYLSLHIGYYDGYGKLKVHPINTSWYYLTHGFLLDTVAAIPWQYLMAHSERPHFNDTDIDRVASYFNHCFWNLLKLIQFYKVFKCISYFEESYFQITKILKIFKLLSFIVLIAHILNSVNLGYICKFDFGVTKDLEFENQDATNKWGKIKCENEFLTKAWLHNGTTGTIKIYTAGLFTIVDWLTNTGIGYFKPSTIFSKIVAIFATLFGFLIFSIMTSTICSIMLADAEETVNFRNNISKLFKFLDKNKVNSNLKQKILGHFKILWDRTKGFDIESKTYTDNYFRDKILLNYHEEIFYRVPLLYHFDMSYMKLILRHVRIQHFQKGAVIVNYKDVLSDIYIVTSGQVEIFSKTEDPLCLLGSGAVFGNIRKNVHGLSKVRVTARRNIELWVVTTQSFFNTVKYYPLVVQELENMLIRKPAYLLPLDTSSFFVFSGSKGLIDELESDEEEVVNKTSTMTCKDSKTIYRRKWTKFNLKPNHSVFKILDFLTFATSLINIFIIPYIFVTQETHYFGYLYLCLEPIFFIRIFFKLHQSYINLYGNVITSNKKLCKRYLNTPRQFFWDIVPNLPVTFIFYSFGSEERFFFYTCVRLFHLLRFYYVIEYFQMYTAKLFRKNWWYFVRLVVYYSILVHLLACTWFMIACPFNQCLHDTWITQFSENVSEKPAVYKIILSYYYILTLVTTTGFGDISPKSYMEVVFTLIAILIGKIFISVIIGSVLKAIYISEKQHLTFDMQAKLLKSYLKDKNISDFLMDKISIYLENLWIHEEGIMDLNIIKSLSYPLQQELMWTLYGNQIGETFVFKGIDQSLLLQICTKLKRSVYFKDDYIAKTGDVSSTMYFINSGNVVVLTKHLQLIETKHVMLQPMDLFGVCQGLCLEECHNYYYRVATYAVEILSLKYEDWSYLLDFFPRDKQQIFVRVHKEYKKMTE